ncbi:Indoleamine 23-dioxygenase [Pyrenophora seminiperda CCB06]|uniref:Indoleamine 2,3-dioxygenase n=1 Tax=Pyrenophora seminiperda CCB06 TaxID=1302712 RepID=A0A3M7MCA5_9PLEO|nr:Indoleamine 23-dioxygenase [Pyrenophora seminiperda CCB06]
MRSMQPLILFVLGSLAIIVFWKSIVQPFIQSWLQTLPKSDIRKEKSDAIKDLAEHHEVAEILSELIQKDGAGSWPPNANHAHTEWPLCIQPYREIYLEMAPLLPQPEPSLDDEVNASRISEFRQRYRDLLSERVDLVEVKKLMDMAEADRWVEFPRDVYNAFYCCIASTRHAYRWATIPVVKVAQLEKVVELPVELTMPWESMQRHFGCPSDGGNVTCNLLLNFDKTGSYIYKINTGMAPRILAAEEAFSRIFYDLESLSLPVYHDMAQAIIALDRGDTAACARHVASITAQMQGVIATYTTKLHDKFIAHSIWLSRIQGFFGWGAGHYNTETNEWEKYDGLSGNQLLLFPAMDAFLGIEQYLSQRDQEMSVPRRQRELCHALRKHSFRARLAKMDGDIHVAEILHNFDMILKQLRLFRAAHRTRAKTYLSQPAPERLPMTAGKSLLKPSIEDSFEFLDKFMVRRLGQTV